jgi:hypothetical protein
MKTKVLTSSYGGFDVFIRTGFFNKYIVSNISGLYGFIN